MQITRLPTPSPYLQTDLQSDRDCGETTGEPNNDNNSYDDETEAPNLGESLTDTLLTPLSRPSLHELATNSSRSSPSLSFLNCLALVVSLQIGSGVFSVPSQVTTFSASAFQGLLTWFSAGLLAWTGASSFIELGLQIQENGGIQEYLTCCYGNFFGYLFSWVWVAIAKPCAITINATVFTAYFCSAFSFDPAPWWVTKPVGLLCIWVVSVINGHGVKVGANVADVFFFLKLATVLIIAVSGIIASVFGLGQGTAKPDNGWFTIYPEARDQSTWARIGNGVTALFGALFCYGGWETIGFVLGDLRDPQRSLPGVTNISMIIVIVGVIVMNISIYLCLPTVVIKENTAVAVKFGELLFGSIGSRLLSVAVCLSALGALNANLFTTTKLCVVASQRRYFPSLLGNLHCVNAEEEEEYHQKLFRPWPTFLSQPLKAFAKATASRRFKQNVPVYAIALNASIASLYFIIGTFNGLLTFIGLSEYMFFILAANGVFVLRNRMRSLQKSGNESQSIYRTWTANPIIFTVVSGFLVTRGLISEPIQGLSIVTIVLMGWLLFVLQKGSR